MSWEPQKLKKDKRTGQNSHVALTIGFDLIFFGVFGLNDFGLRVEILGL